MPGTGLSTGHMCVECMNEQVREFKGKRKRSGGTENAKGNAAGELGSMGEVGFELDLERMGKISICGDDKMRNLG